MPTGFTVVHLSFMKKIDKMDQNEWFRKIDQIAGLVESREALNHSDTGQTNRTAEKLVN